MAHDDQHPAQDGPRRDGSPASPIPLPPPTARAHAGTGDVRKANPFSWAIAELQGDLELEPAEDLPRSTNGVATTVCPAVASAAEAPAHDEWSDSDDDPEESSPSVHRHPAPEPDRPLPVATPRNGAEANGTGDDRVPPPAESEDAPYEAPAFVDDEASVTTPPLTPEPTLARPSQAVRLGPMVAVALAFGMIGALIVLGLQAASGPSRNAPKPDSSRDALPAQNLARVQASLGQLSERLDALGDRVGRVEASKAATPPEVSNLRADVRSLSATASDLAPLAGDMKRIDDRVDHLSTSLKAVRDEIAALRATNEKTAQASTPAPAPAPTPGPGAGRAVADEIHDASPLTGDARDVTQGINLFKQGRYKEALGIFNRLEATSPDDARVWYFAALSQGLATDQLTGLTERLVEKGIERERAGTPSTAVIEAAINDLTIAQGRDWLAHYRSRLAGSPKAASLLRSGTGR